MDWPKAAPTLLDLPVIEVVADELRELVEFEWPDLNLPPREPNG